MAAKLLLSIAVVIAAAAILVRGGDQPPEENIMGYLRCIRRTIPRSDTREISWEDALEARVCGYCLEDIHYRYIKIGYLPEYYVEALKIHYNYNQTALDFHLCEYAYPRCADRVRDKFDQFKKARMRRIKSLWKKAKSGESIRFS